MYSSKMFFADDKLFWIEYDSETSLYSVDWGGGKGDSLSYSGPPDAHRKVLYDAVQRLVRAGDLPEELLDIPIHAFQEMGASAP